MGSEGIEDADLVRNLRPAEDDEQWPGGLAHRAQVLDFRCQEIARGDAGDTVGHSCR